MSKKTRNKKTPVIIIVFTFLAAAVCMLLFSNRLISLNGEENVVICYGEEFKDEGAHVLWNLAKPKTEGCADSSKIGIYRIRYSFLTRSVYRTVTVEDQKRPELELYGSEDVFLPKGLKYSEEGFRAWDEIDGDITDRVQISDDIDYEKDGTYRIEYKVFDSAGNGVRATRKVSVSTESPLSLGLLEFDLWPYFPDVICRETEFDEEKYSQTLFYGDSFMGNMAEYGYIPWSLVLSKPSASTDESDMNMHYLNTHGTPMDWSFYQALEYYRPKYAVLLLNSDWTGRWTPEYLRESCMNAYKKMTEISPDTRFVICSLFPLDEAYNSDDYIASYGFNRNDRVNKMNVYMCELCREFGFKFINAAEAVRDPQTGACRDEYISDDQIHLSYTGFGVAADYIKNHLDY